MRKVAFKVCVSKFEALLKRSDIGPEQRQILEACRDKIRKLGRNKDPAEEDVYRCIDEVATMLIKFKLP
jgi:hypothetical protein